MSWHYHDLIILGKQCQAIIITIADLLLILFFRTNFEIRIRNLVESAYKFVINENALQNNVCNWSAILFSSQCVDAISEMSIF